MLVLMFDFVVTICVSNVVTLSTIVIFVDLECLPVVAFISDIIFVSVCTYNVLLIVICIVIESDCVLCSGI